LQVHFPDGQIWFNNLGSPYFKEPINNWERFRYTLIHPLPVSAGPQQFMAGSNWVSATTDHVEFWNKYGGGPMTAVGYLDTVAVKADGTLWIPSEAKPVVWTGAKMIQFGDETNWQQVIRKNTGLLLLKQDGTLWQWGTNQVEPMANPLANRAHVQAAATRHQFRLAEDFHALGQWPRQKK
jgi:hypothetical protein